MVSGLPLNWFAQRFYHKRPGDFPVYSPYATLKELQIGEFKQQMWDNFGLKLRGFTPSEKPAARPPVETKAAKKSLVAETSPFGTVVRYVDAVPGLTEPPPAQSATQVLTMAETDFNGWLDVMNTRISQPLPTVRRRRP